MNEITARFAAMTARVEREARAASPERETERQLAPHTPDGEESPVEHPAGRSLCAGGPGNVPDLRTVGVQEPDPVRAARAPFESEPAKPSHPLAPGPPKRTGPEEGRHGEPFDRRRAIRYVGELLAQYEARLKFPRGYTVGMRGKVAHLTQELGLMQAEGEPGETLARRWDFVRFG